MEEEEEDVFEDEAFLLQVDSLVQDYALHRKKAKTSQGEQAVSQAVSHDTGRWTQERPEGEAASGEGGTGGRTLGRVTQECGAVGTATTGTQLDDAEEDVFEDEDFLLQIDSLVQNYSVGKEKEGMVRGTPSDAAGGHASEKLDSMGPPIARARSTGQSKAEVQPQPQRGTLPQGFALRAESVGVESAAGVNSVPLDSMAAETWVLPSDPRARPYQSSIACSCLFTNTLVCLPTGLGKTLVAAVVMANYRRWFPDGVVIFTAPTRPLVHQQIDACTKIMRIPKEQTVELTGRRPIEDREREWQKSAIFFATPQVVENDIVRGVCPRKRIVCVVFDECHRAVGKHAYASVARHLRSKGVKHRCLGLSATPGSDRKRLQEVLTNLGISKVEFRAESDPEIKDYVHLRHLEKRIVGASSSKYNGMKYWKGDMKICELRLVLAEHFGNSPNKNVIVFCATRERVHDIVAALSGDPGIKAAAFIGQGSSSLQGKGAKGGKGRGMNQKMQQEVLKQFRKGLINLLVATCVAEEGLDIPEVGLIVCYDASVSPGRNIQRMGRTGRKEEGRVVYLLTKKERDDYDQMEEREKRIHSALSSGFLSLSLSPRMIPHKFQPRPILLEENKKEKKKNAAPPPISNNTNSSPPPPKGMSFDFFFPSSLQKIFIDKNNNVTVTPCNV
ncbi:P-loop-containing nucleoside triphosphate hydrolase [Chloropicon primus]|nr:P-loop-containing nucleoside triphosphate hydrolase [Chloropicon primus]